MSSPLLDQYRAIKSRHPGAILFFRMGDFYEMMYDDAHTAARALNITLTSRGDGVPLAGVPVKAAAGYLRQFVSQGFRVAICEQVEDPRDAKGIVQRAVVETVTPGAFLDEEWTPGSRHNWLLALAPAERAIGLAAIDLSTGEFALELVSPDALTEALGRWAPAEVVFSRDAEIDVGETILATRRDGWEFEPSHAGEELARRFQLGSLDSLGLGRHEAPCIAAAGALLRYIGELQPAGLPQLRRPRLRRSDDHCWVDEMTRRNLELTEPLRAGARDVTLFETIDRTLTPMGGRLLRDWILSPLAQVDAINARLDAVQRMVDRSRPRQALREALDGVRDVERLAARAAADRANPREMAALRDSLLRLPAVASALADVADGDEVAPIARATAMLDPLADVATALEAGLVARPPVNIVDGGVIAPGHDARLDELRDLRDNGKQALAAIQQRERERTGIQSLKVGFNKVFGYYLEITHANAASVPADYERRQTLSNAERYVTPELKEYEEKVLGAEDEIARLESSLFSALRRTVGTAIERIQTTCGALAELDVFASLADTAATQQYTRPVVHSGYQLSLIGARHPVIERMMPRERFVPNDVHFDEASRVLLVTGPNMAGKSTILRQIGLCTLLAQIGSFIPARAATIGVVDRLFTRVGASDNLAGGQSTFMVEMSETSAILHNATRRSLVLLDEIGRGTSTYDGVAIAWAVTEHVHDRIGCRTMFATHYHELMQLPERLAHARNFNVAVRETGDGIVFLHRLEPGGTDRSYGIHVAQLAGLPARVVARAREVLGTLEGEHRVVPGSPVHPDPAQPSLFDAGAADQSTARDLRAAKIALRLRGLDPNTMTPIEALQELARIRDELEEGQKS